MGKLQALEIMFDENNEVYKPGDTISGNFRIVLNGDKGDIRGIKVMCKGKAYTHWTETIKSGDNQRVDEYSWKVKFFKREVLLRGEGKHNKTAPRMRLPVGDHRFPFQFQLPTDTTLPPPFEGPHGWVRYYVKATIDRPWRFNHHVVRYFSFLTTKDLSRIPNILTSPSAITQKTVCCLCCESGPITIRAATDKGGYVPGENILVSLEVDNQCGRELVSLKAELLQESSYRAKHEGQTHTRTHTKAIGEILFDNINDEQTMVFDRTPLPIPAIPPSSFENCPNIDVSYVVKIEADVSRTPIDATVFDSIIIGTVPAFPYLVDFYEQCGQRSQSGESPTRDQEGVAYPTPPPPALPPLTYELDVAGLQEMEEKDGFFDTTMYAPKYPFYDPRLLAVSLSSQAGGSTNCLDEDEDDDGDDDGGDENYEEEDDAPVTCQPQGAGGYPPQHPHDQETVEMEEVRLDDD